MRPLSLLALLAVHLVSLPSAAVCLAPLGPRTLGILEGFSSDPVYSNPASRADGFGDWLGWRPQYANQALDFTHWSDRPTHTMHCDCPHQRQVLNATARSAFRSTLCDFC